MCMRVCLCLLVEWHQYLVTRSTHTQTDIDRLMQRNVRAVCFHHCIELFCYSKKLTAHRYVTALSDRNLSSCSAYVVENGYTNTCLNSTLNRSCRNGTLGLLLFLWWCNICSFSFYLSLSMNDSKNTRTYLKFIDLLTIRKNLIVTFFV